MQNYLFHKPYLFVLKFYDYSFILSLISFIFIEHYMLRLTLRNYAKLLTYTSLLKYFMTSHLMATFAYLRDNKFLFLFSSEQNIALDAKV